MTPKVPQQTKNGKVEREARLRHVPLDRMRINPSAQRDLRQARVDHLVANLDLELIGAPIVNERGGWFYVIDGQHRIEALRQFGFTDEKIQCWTYVGLTEQEEAERFLVTNDALAVDAISKYRSAITAERSVECDIDRVVRSLGLVVSRDKIPGAIGAVGTLRRVYARSGPSVLAHSLAIIRDAFGDAGLEAVVIDGIGLVVQRYADDLDRDKAVKALSGMNGGVGGLLGLAERLRAKTGNQKAQCVAATTVETINRGRGGKKLASWWKDAA